MTMHATSQAERAVAHMRDAHPDLTFTWQEEATTNGGGRKLRIEGRGGNTADACIVVDQGGWFRVRGGDPHPPHNAMPTIRRLLGARDRSPMMRGRAV